MFVFLRQVNIGSDECQTQATTTSRAFVISGVGGGAPLSPQHRPRGAVREVTHQGPSSAPPQGLASFCTLTVSFHSAWGVPVPTCAEGLGPLSFEGRP